MKTLVIVLFISYACGKNLYTGTQQLHIYKHYESGFLDYLLVYFTVYKWPVFSIRICI